MDRSLPFIEVTVNGRTVSGAFYELLHKATIRDAPGQDSDSVELTFDDAGNAVEMPTEGAVMVVKFGFRDGGAAEKMGTFIYERASISGGKTGELVTLSGRSADRRADLKEPASEHFDDKTIGAIVEELAGRHGYDAKVDADLAGQALPYIARVNQSTADFLTRLADRSRAQFSVKDGKFLFLRRGILSAITVDRSECDSWSFEIEPRPRHGATEAGWFDRAKSQVVYEKHATGADGPTKRLRPVYGTAAEAKAAAASEGDELGRRTGSGSLTLGGRPDIMADQPINATGFRAEANGAWRAAGVDHTFDGKYMTSISLEAPEEGKS